MIQRVLPLLVLGLLSVMAPGTAAPASDALDPARQELPAEQNAYTIWAKVIPELKLPKDQVLQDAFDQVKASSGVSAPMNPTTAETARRTSSSNCRTDFGLKS